MGTFWNRTIKLRTRTTYWYNSLLRAVLGAEDIAEAEVPWVTFLGDGSLEIKPTLADLFASPNLRTRITPTGRNAERAISPGVDDRRAALRSSPPLEYRAENDYLLPSKNKIGTGIGYTGPREAEGAKSITTETFEKVEAQAPLLNPRAAAGNHIFEKNLQDERSFDMNTRDMLEHYAKTALRTNTRHPTQIRARQAETVRNLGVGLSRADFRTISPAPVLKAALVGRSAAGHVAQQPTYPSAIGLSGPTPSDVFSDYALRGYSEKL